MLYRRKYHDQCERSLSARGTADEAPSRSTALGQTFHDDPQRNGEYVPRIRRLRRVTGVLGPGQRVCQFADSRLVRLRPDCWKKSCPKVFMAPMLRLKANRKNARDAARPHEAEDRSSLAKREVVPPEEFAGFAMFGEYPEFRPGDQETTEPQDADSERQR